MTLIDNNVIITVILPPHNLGQLIREDNAVKNKTYVYTYDNAGNITSKKTYSLTAASSEPSGTPTTTTYGYSTGSWGDLLTSFNGSSITYDAIGNPLAYYDERYFTWAGRRLVEAATFAAESITFKYNDEGLRTSKTVDGVTTNYYYNGSTLIAEKTGNKITVYMYNSTGIVGFRYRTSSYAKGVWDTYLYEKNLQGDIIAVYDENGTKKISYTYDAWGNFTATYHNGASATNLHNPYTYRGYYYEQDLGLYYLNSRYYDSNTGRFINADDVGVITATPYALTDKNLFAYCDNNPVIRTDQAGEFWNILIGAGVGAVVGAASQLASDLITSALNNDLTISNWQTYTGAAVGGAVGGAILGGTGNVALANVASGFVTTGVGMSLEKVTGDSDKSWAEIGINAVADAAIGYGLGKLPGVKNITAGRNNMSAVYKSGLTKLRNNTASHMSKKVVGKGILSGFVSGIATDFYYGIKQHSYDLIKDDILKCMR